MGRSGPTEDRRRAAGLCPHCGQVPELGLKYCQAILEQKRVWARSHKRRRCKICHRAWHGAGTACPGCASAIASIREAHGECTSLQTAMPGRAETIARYAARAALGLPLFE